MEIRRELVVHDPATQRAAVPIGAYDGVHVGHRMVIAEVRRLADERSMRSAVVTFDRHPASVVRPESAPLLITDPEQKLEQLAEAYRVDLRAAASQFALAHPAVACIVPGTRRPGRGLQNLDLCRVDIPSAFLQELRAQGLVDERAPLPE